MSGKKFNRLFVRKSVALLVLFPAFMASSQVVISQTSKGEAITCYKDVLICPAVGKLVIGNKALSISRN
jgi:hypothetical protein